MRARRWLARPWNNTEHCTDGKVRGEDGRYMGLCYFLVLLDIFWYFFLLFVTVGYNSLVLFGMGSSTEHCSDG